MPNALATMIAETAHLAPMEKPDLFNQLLLEFLDTLFGSHDD